MDYLENEILKNECYKCGKSAGPTINNNDLIVFEDSSKNLGYLINADPTSSKTKPSTPQNEVDVFIQELERELSTNEPIQDLNTVKIKTITTSPSKNIIYEGAFASSPIKWMDMTQNPDEIHNEHDHQLNPDSAPDGIKEPGSDNIFNSDSTLEKKKLIGI
jgi:hypothetical protein